MNKISLHLQDICFSRGHKALFGAVSLRVDPGHALVLRGANGSGKTSLLRVMAGLLPVQSGILFAPKPVFLGVKTGMKADLGVGEFLDFYLSLYQVVDDPAKDPFYIRPFAGRMCGTLSHGQQKRVQLSLLALLPQKLWLLDEPMNALDTQSRRQFLDLLRTHLDQGGMAVIAAHDDPDLQDFQSFEMQGAQ